MNYASPDLERCEEAIGYRFNNRSLLKTALTHSSCANTPLESYERLEFLGDATLGLVVSRLLYQRFPQKMEGELSQLKGLIVSRTMCHQIALTLKLDEFLQIGKSLVSLPDSLTSNAMESVIGAIFLDGGYEEARLFIEEKFHDAIDEALLIEEKQDESLKGKDSSAAVLRNYKMDLQIKTQKESDKIQPTYVLQDERGPSHSKRFKIAVRIGSTTYQGAWGKSKKEAEQRAAGNALCQMAGEAPPFSDSI